MTKFFMGIIFGGVITGITISLVTPVNAQSNSDPNHRAAVALESIASTLKSIDRKVK